MNLLLLETGTYKLELLASLNKQAHRVSHYFLSTLTQAISKIETGLIIF